MLWSLVVLGCDGGPPHGDKDRDTGSPTTPTAPPDYCGVAHLFAARCAFCHSGPGGLQGGLDLTGDLDAALVGQPSPEYPGETLVVAGDPAGSFVLAKLEGTQASTEGVAMPQGGAPLTPDQVEVVRSWIAAGAPPDCGTTPTPTTPTRYHPADFAEPPVHGKAAKYADLDCQACHGEALDGGTSGVSCDECHQDGWRTACTYCHGGVETSDGAPPENLDDSVDAAELWRFPVHTVHVTETIHPAWGCDECHVQPTDVLTPGHLFADPTPGEAEVVLAPGTYAPTGTCQSTYCHGDGQTVGDVGIGFVTSCDGCHPYRGSPDAAIVGMSGQHHRHVVGQALDCSLCHSATVDSSQNIVGPDVHVDGRPTVALPDGMTFDAPNLTCTGTCHFKVHVSNQW